MAILGTLVAVLVIAVLLLGRRYRGADHSAYDTPITAPLVTDDEISDTHEQVVSKLNAFNASPTRDIQIARKRFEDLFYQDVDAEIIDTDVAGVPGEWVLAPGANPDLRLLYLHGGAFRVGSPRAYRYITQQLSLRCGAAVLAIDYRMQPEFKTLDAHLDARTAYQWILEHSPTGLGAAKAVFVAGDSAGGNLTLSVLAWARDQGLPEVNAAIAFAPLTDATMSSPTWSTNAATDPFLGPALGPLIKLPKFVVNIAMRLSSGTAVNQPVLSPLLGDLGSLPDTLIQASRDEVLFGDAQRYANKANAQGSLVTLQVWPKLVHVFQGFPELPESDHALAHVADFIKARTPN